MCLVRCICATIQRCRTIVYKLDFSRSTRNNTVRAEKSTRPWYERRLGLTAGDTPVNFASVWGPILHAFRCIQRLTSSLKKRTGTVGAGHVCMLPTNVLGPMYLCDNPALPNHSVQTRLFEVHKEQHSASREKYAPVVRTAARTHGRDTPVNFASVWGPNLHAFRCIQRLTSSS